MTNPPTTLVFENGSVLMPDGAFATATVAVRDGSIEEVTADGDTAARLRSRAEQVIDLAGRSLLPGFYDAHVHPVLGCVELAACDLRGAASLTECLDRIARYAAAHPGEPWVQGGGWDHSVLQGVSPRRLLDRILPDRPAMLASIDHHSFWVNSAALAIAGVDAGTVDPPGGHIDRDGDGEPDGILHENAVDLVRAFAPPDTEEDFAEALLTAQRVLHGFGVVGWQDAMVHPSPADALTHAAYRRADREGRLTARVSGALLWDVERPFEELDEQLAELVALRDVSRAEGSRYRIDAVKIMCDGVAETHTAAMLEPYAAAEGTAADDHGLSLLDARQLAVLAERLSGAGFQIHFHALGDRAVRNALDAVEHAVARTGRTDLRHQLAHLQFVHGDDIARFGRLPVTANLQALWAAYDPEDLAPDPRIGAARTERQYPFGDLVAAGSRIAMGSDWPVSTPNPFPAIQVAATRLQPDAPPGTPPLDASQRLPLPGLLTAYTQGSAHACNSDDGGAIAPGRHADLVVVDRDLRDVPASEYAGTRVTTTFVAGVPVFEDES